MKIVLQRVTEATVKVNSEIVGAINNGLLVLLGIEDEDNQEDINWLCNKLIHLRIFNDEQSIMNCSLIDMQGEILVVSQFTLMASTKKGNRPSYINASKPEKAVLVYNQFLTHLSCTFAGKIATGVFGADMKVSLINDGPVTIIIDSKNKI
jgi:D-aminoacyl-tRNA deacylase